MYKIKIAVRKEFFLKKIGFKPRKKIFNRTDAIAQTVLNFGGGNRKRLEFRRTSEQ